MAFKDLLSRSELCVRETSLSFIKIPLGPAVESEVLQLLVARRVR